MITVYTDSVDLRAVGHVRAVRASVVDWDESQQAWIARIVASGEVLGPFTTRAEAVEAERAVLATRLAAAAEEDSTRPTAAPTARLPYTRARGASLATPTA